MVSSALQIQMVANLTKAERLPTIAPMGTIATTAQIPE
jgi:hypothetical protein